MRTISIAVSGDKGSFSEEAGFSFAKEHKLTANILCATDAEGVLKALDNGHAEIGILPVANSRGGLVDMSFEAMGKHNFKFLENFELAVEQCLMSKPGKTLNDIKRITSHPQSITQCETYIKRTLPNVRIIYWDDTAKAAKDLANGVLTEDTAVIAPLICAEQYGLELLEKGIQDINPNYLTFIVVRK